MLGLNAMHYAARGGNSATLLYLKEFPNALDIDATTNALQTPLMLAVISRDKATVKAVLEASARPGLMDCLGKTAEWHADSIADNVAAELR